MAHSPAPALLLVDADRPILEKITRSTTASAGLVQRARIVLLAAEGRANERIAEAVGCSVNTVKAWRRRYGTGGVKALEDRARSGRPRVIDRSKVITATLTPPPKSWGITHWSTRSLAKKLGISNAQISQIWKEWGVQPWRRGTFKFSTDPELEAKVVDVVGLYLDPPENAVILSLDEKSQIQALDRTSPLLPILPGKIERGTPDYVRHGTTTLFAALNVATGQITSACKPRHRTTEFLAFLKQVTRAYPEGNLHIVMDNYSTHKSKPVTDWLQDNPRVKLHFTPTHASWMNQVEIFFNIVQRQAVSRGVFKSVQQLTSALRRFVDHYNKDCQPFKWTKTAEQIIPKIKSDPSTTYLTRH
jgi:transposase